MAMGQMGGGGAGGFDWMAAAQKIGDINQTAYNQEANTSFSGVADPAGFTYQSIQKWMNFANQRKQQKKDNAFKSSQQRLIDAQTEGVNLANTKERQAQDDRRRLRSLLLSGSY